MFPTGSHLVGNLRTSANTPCRGGSINAAFAYIWKYLYCKSDITHSYNQDNGHIFCRAEWPPLREPCIVLIFSFSLRPFICSENIKWRPTFYWTVPGDKTSVMDRIPFLQCSGWKICIFRNRCHQGMGQALKAVVKRSSRRVMWRKGHLQLYGYSKSY